MAEGPAVVPAVFYRDPMAALHWLEKAFGFETSLLVTDDDNNVGHAEMSFRGGAIGVGGEWASPELLGPAEMKSPASIGGVGTQFVRIHLRDGIDAHCERARAAGARITQEPADQFYGARTYRALDPEGHVWNFDQDTAQLSLAEMEQASGLKIRERL
ncbi:MAG TPA: VOC family protein [Caulobacteraceae bacterium]|nr:VOC family protein [Caulobacteraceae bacterium]